MTKIISFVFLLLLAACNLSPFSPDVPYWRIDATQFVADYAWTWENCGSKVEHAPVYKYDELTFYVVQGESFKTPERPDAIGLFSQGRIFIAENYLHSQWLIRHEILHSQIRASGHPKIFYDCNLKLGR